MRQSVERIAVALTIFLTLVACSAFGQHFNRTDLTANSASVASVPNLDPNLVNASVAFLRVSLVGFGQWYWSFNPL